MCKDGFCGAEDCALCRPQGRDWDEEANQADLDNDYKREQAYVESKTIPKKE